MPTIQGMPDGYQTIEIDIADHLDYVKIEIDTDDLLEALREDLSDAEILAAMEMGGEDLLHDLHDKEVIGDGDVIAYLKNRNDLLQLALAGELKPVDFSEQAERLDPNDAESVAHVRAAMEALLKHDAFRLAVHDAVLRWAAAPPQLQAAVETRVNALTAEAK